MPILDDVQINYLRKETDYTLIQMLNSSSEIKLIDNSISVFESIVLNKL